MSEQHERRTDFETRDKITKLEIVSQQINDGLKNIHQDFNKMGDAYDKHVSENNNAFAEVNKALVNITAVMETFKGSIGDLKETSKNMVDTQNKLLNQFSLIDMHNKIIEDIKEDHKILKQEVNNLKHIESRIEGSWKTLTVIATIVAFVVSTAISIGAFKLGASSTQTSYLESTSKNA